MLKGQPKFILHKERRQEKLTNLLTFTPRVPLFNLNRQQAKPRERESVQSTLNVTI